VRKLTIYYDYIQKRARADIEEGYEAAKTYIRKYDDSNEYMVRYPPIDDCKRSYLGVNMPFPDISAAYYENIETISGTECYHYIHEDFESIVHIYMSVIDNKPVRLIQESIENGVSTALMTYDYSFVSLQAPADEVFEV